MNTRVIPKSMQSNLDVDSTSLGSKKEISRVENLDPNTCPICHEMMISAKVNGHDVKVCMEHNIVMPVKD